MNRRVTSVLSVLAVAGVMPVLASQAPAHAVAGIKGDLKDTTAITKPDNKPDALSTKRSNQRQQAVDALVTGKAKYTGKGADRTIKMKDGTQVDYPVNQTAQLLTFLVDFGDGGNPDFPDNTSGPVHNQLPEPDRSKDNSTYWEPDFSREHYLDMFFKGLPDQNGESFHNVYKEMSSGRFDLEGDVSDWVTLPHAESYYQSKVTGDDGTVTGDEDGTSMKNYLQDTGNAWFDAQQAQGKSDQEIKDYLAQFDVWDRYDYDHDGDYNEPDGYIDHFQAIHAGGGEEAGNPTWTIWSHRWAANPNAKVGPDGNQAGGVEIGDTGYWIRDYTTEPEDGGLGVFSHEFGHDLGLPDYYDTNGGDNSTAFWNLMSSGSWMGHGDGSIGTTPDQMGATEKLFLGWYGTSDLAIVDGKSAPLATNLGPSYHATQYGAQAIAVNLPQGSATVDVVDPDQGSHYLYSGNTDATTTGATSPQVTVPADDPTLTARVNYDFEPDYDYGYVQVSNDGGDTWTNVETNVSATTDPNQANAGFGITGASDGWVDLSADLTAYAGQDVKIRFSTVTDPNTHGLGLSVDSISLGGTLLTDVEDGAPDWTLSGGFRVMDGSSYTTKYDQYYLAENRQYQGYDKTLAQGPYSFDYAGDKANWVDQFPYQDGLLVWYSSGLYLDNNTSGHVGGSNLPVDANPTYTLWEDDGTPAYYGSGRLESYDSTFDVDETDGLHLTNENYDGATYDVDAHPSIPVFEDSDPDAYMDYTYAPRSAWYSTPVAGVGTEIQVLSSNEKTGQMRIKVGTKFVAATAPASIKGRPGVGATLTAVSPTWFQDGVATAYQWQRDGDDIAGATGATYKVGLADKGHVLTVVATGTKADYAATRSTSAPVTVANGAAPVATKVPTITGQAKVGAKLTAHGGSWPLAGTHTFTWKVAGRTVGTGTTHTLTPADAGKTVTVTETLRADGYAAGTATSRPTAKVAGLATRTTVAVGRAKPHTKVEATITVTAPGLTPTGTVKVTYRGKVIKAKAWLKNGKVTVTLPAKNKGSFSLYAKYTPNSPAFTWSSKTVKVNVRP